MSARTTNLTRRTLTLAAGLSVAALAPAALAAAAPQPTYGAGAVDGDTSEFQAGDYFADMNRDGVMVPTKDAPKQAELFARYNCKTGTLFLNVRTVDKMDLAPLANPADHFVRIAGGTTLVGGTSANFRFIDHDQSGVPDGWEASAQLAPGSYDDLQVVTKMREHDKDAGHNASVPGWSIPIDIVCDDKVDPTGGGDPTPTPTPLPETQPVPTPITPVVPTEVKSATPRNTALRASKTGPRRTLSGRVVTYRLRVTNRTAVTARRVIIRDLLPSGMVLAKRPAGAKVRGRIVQWNLGNLGPRRTAVRTVRVRVLNTTQGRRCNTMVARAGNARTVRNRACTVVKRINTAILPAVTG